jgi:hypothetical protein
MDYKYIHLIVALVSSNVILLLREWYWIKRCDKKSECPILQYMTHITLYWVLNVDIQIILSWILIYIIIK